MFDGRFSYDSVQSSSSPGYLQTLGVICGCANRNRHADDCTSKFVSHSVFNTITPPMSTTLIGIGTFLGKLCPHGIDNPLQSYLVVELYMDYRFSRSCI